MSKSPAPEDPANSKVPADLLRARRTIDNIDAALVHLLAERFRCTQDVGLLKAAQDLPATDSEREAQQVARLRSLARESGLDPVFAEKFLKFIVDEVIRHHVDIKQALHSGATQAEILGTDRTTQ